MCVGMDLTTFEYRSYIRLEGQRNKTNIPCGEIQFVIYFPTLQRNGAVNSPIPNHFQQLLKKHPSLDYRGGPKKK